MIPLASGPTQDADELLARETSPELWGWCTTQHGERFAMIQILAKDRESSRIVLPQGAAQLIGLALSGPDQALVRAGKDLERAQLLGLPSKHTVVMPIGADEVSKQHCISRITLGATDAMPITIAVDGEGVNGVDLVPGHPQGSNQQSVLALDPDHDLGRLISMLSQQLLYSPGSGERIRDFGLS
jgi:hypothetical protein